MYLNNGGLGFDIGGIFGTVGDWLKKQVGVPTSAEERAAESARAYQAEVEKARYAVQTQAGLQQYLVIGGIAVAGLAVVLLLGRKK